MSAIEPFLDFVTFSFETGQELLAERSQAERKQHGQFLTPVAVARFMANQLGPIRPGDRVLDPAIGSGVLACAVIERVIGQGYPHEFWLDGYETDPQLAQTARAVLARAAARAAEQGIIVHIRVYEDDFVLNAVPSAQPYLFLAETSPRSSKNSCYSHIISNPPYFKLNSQDRRVKAVAGQVKGHTNIYTLFLALAAQNLTPDGRASFIVPRSFCSGAYFAGLRQAFFAEALPESVHLFSSRQEIFKQDSVLQENIILTFRRRKTKSKPNNSSIDFLDISTLNDSGDLVRPPLSRSVSFEHFLGQRHGTFFFRLPTGQLDEDILEVVDGWGGSLGQYGLHVSTGPVVAFRARDWLTGSEAVANQQAVPLLWMQNVKKQHVEWPVENGNKSQGFLLREESRPLLVPTRNYLLLRRFSSKEEARRLVAAPFVAGRYDSQWIGLENHLNYIYKKQGDFETAELFGLSALLNSALIDRYFRIINGNTQVNAAELRALPLPPQEIIKKIGQQLLTIKTRDSDVDIDTVVFNTLRETEILPPDFPTFRETRISMGKIQEAQAVLQQLGLPKNQQNEMAALTLLVLAQLSEDTPWQEADKQSLRIHDILLGIKARYDREYAENTRETIRRQVIHQFEQAGLVIRNPDDPTLATNSPRTHYSLSEATIQVIRTYQSKEWSQAVQTFVTERGRLLEVYQKNQQRRKIPLSLADGTAVHLSPGEHNELQAAVIEEFGPRFAPGARLLYLGDTARKMLVFDAEGFEALDISISGRDKLPDIVLYDEKRNWLFLIEAVSSHGPMSPKRHFELAKMLEGCSVGCIYVSAFPDFATFKSFLNEIAWETEVWLVETPDHLIHFNGDRFLGPHT